MPIHPDRHVPIAWEKVAIAWEKVAIAWEKMDMTWAGSARPVRWRCQLTVRRLAARQLRRDPSGQGQRPDRRMWCHITVRRPVAGRSEGRSTGRGRSLFAGGVTSSLAGTLPERFRRLSSGREGRCNLIAGGVISPSRRRLPASGRIGQPDRCPGGNVSAPTAGAASSLLAGPRPGRRR
jgi:hypothetical protein